MKERLSMILFVLVLGFVLTTALVSVDAFTAPYIEKNKAIKLRIGILTALGISFTAEKIDDVFAENVTKKTIGQAEFYITGNEDVAFEFAGPGLWGPIHGIVAVEADLEY